MVRRAIGRLCAMGVAVAAGSAALADDFDEGYEAAERGDFALAVMHYTNALDNPVLPLETRISAFNNRGVAFHNLGEHARAIKDYSIAVSLDYSYATAFTNRALAHADLGAYKLAVGDIGRSVRIDPLDATSWSDRSYWLVQFGDFAQAIRDLDRALEIEPGNTSFLTDRCWALARTGDFRSGEANCTQAVETAEDPSDAHWHRGLVRFAFADYAGAAADFGSPGVIDPEDPWAYAVLWRYLADAHNGSDDTAILTGTSEAFGPDEWPGPIFRYYLGLMTADDLLESAADPDPVIANEQACEAYFYIAHRLLLDGNTDEAVTMLQRTYNTGVISFIEYFAAEQELLRRGLL